MGEPNERAGVSPGRRAGFDRDIDPRLGTRFPTQRPSDQDPQGKCAHPAEPGCNRHALEGASPPIQPRSLAERCAEQQEGDRHRNAGSGRVGSPYEIPSPGAPTRGYECGQGYPDEDRDRAEIMELAFAGRHGGPRPRVWGVSELGRRITAHWVGHEPSRADQPQASPSDDRRGYPRASESLRCRTQRYPEASETVERTDDHEVGALEPAPGTGSQRTDWVTAPVVASPPTADRSESSHEQGPARHSACQQSPLPSASAALRSLHTDTLSSPANLAPALPLAPWLTTEPMRTGSPMRTLTHPGGTRAWGAPFT